MNYQTTASEIIRYIGGAENVIHCEHCSTRLRFTLADKTKVNETELKKVSGVMGVLSSSQFQVVIGTDVVEVYTELMKLCDLDHTSLLKEKKEKKKFANVFMEMITGIFQPLVPAIAGAGILKSLLMLLSLTGLMAADSVLYTTLVRISDATIYFLPLMVAVTTANVMKCNRLVAIAAVGYLIHPSTLAALSAEGGMQLFGITLTNVAYPNQVFPAILCVIFLAYMERLFNKITPKVIRIFFVPMMALLITIPATLIVLGPLGYNVGTLLTSVILFLYDKMAFVALGVLGAVLPFMVAAGMHKTLIPYSVNMLSTTGYETLYLPASLAHNISECGACFAVALKTKNETLKQTSLSAGISALMGITEPALYGVTLQHKNVLIGVSASGAIAGAMIGLFSVKAFALVGPGLASMTMYVDPADSRNLMMAIAGFVIAIVASFVITFLLWKDEEVEKIEETTETNASDEVNILVAPLKGKSIPLDEVKDEMFASRTLGDGIAVIPENGELCAPVDAEVMMVFETKHAIGLKSANGAELLIHIGINTVTMEGKGFETLVKTGDVVKAGTPLIRFDLERIKQAELDPTVCIIVSNSAEYKVLNQNYGDLKQGDILFDTKKGN